MTILERLSSQTGDRTEAANRAVASQCVAGPALLAEIADGLGSEDERLAGDCAEVMTLVAETRPELVVPYAERLVPVLDHRYTRARWEATHTLALLAIHTPEIIQGLLPKVAQMIQEDESIIVRDHAVKMVANYAAMGPAEAEESYPILVDALAAWGGRHAHHALPGLGQVALYYPGRRGVIRSAAQSLLDHRRRVVRTGAERLLRSVNG